MRSSVYEVTSVRGLGRLIKLPHSAEERRPRVKDDGSGFEGGGQTPLFEKFFAGGSLV
jgi:hypothetical protein